MRSNNGAGSGSSQALCTISVIDTPSLTCHVRPCHQVHIAFQAHCAPYPQQTCLASPAMLGPVTKRIWPLRHRIKSRHASPNVPCSTPLTCHVWSCDQVHLALQAQVIAHRPRLSGVLPEGEEAVKLHTRRGKGRAGSSSGDLQIGSKGSEVEGVRAPREGRGWVRQLGPAG